jgi:hypothetical protein
MENNALVALCQKYSLGMVFTDSAGLSYDEMSNSLEQGKIPDEAIIWEPFEDYQVDGVLSVLDEYHAIMYKYTLDVLDLLHDENDGSVA